MPRLYEVFAPTAALNVLPEVIVIVNVRSEPAPSPESMAAAPL